LEALKHVHFAGVRVWVVGGANLSVLGVGVGWGGVGRGGRGRVELAVMKAATKLRPFSWFELPLVNLVDLHNVEQSNYNGLGVGVVVVKSMLSNRLGGKKYLVLYYFFNVHCMNLNIHLNANDRRRVAWHSA
jgi:hypothetical protein